MNKISGIILGVYLNFFALSVCAADKFDILPDLPEPLANAAQASAVSTVDTTQTLAAQSVGHEPNFLSMIFSLVFVILLIYMTGIIYTKLNKFGAKTLKVQNGEKSNSHVDVISTTPLGANKTLHVVELDGKRMLIGASANSIHLIKDLGSAVDCDITDGEYSKIEIPNIRIPKIEIPKIEIPSFTKIVSKNKESNIKQEEIKDIPEEDSFEISDIYEEENPDGIIDKLFHTATEESSIHKSETYEKNEHKVDPDEFVLYKKYL